jgi:hypothetical protein
MKTQKREVCKSDRKRVREVKQLRVAAHSKAHAAGFHCGGCAIQCGSCYTVCSGI